MNTARATRPARPATAGLRAAALMLVVLVVGCGAVDNNDAERARIAQDRAVLEQRVVELEAALHAVPPVPTPMLADRLILRQFVREPAPAGTSAGTAERSDALTVELCVETFARGEPLAGIPPALTTSCLPIAVSQGASHANDPGGLIDRFVADPEFACWVSAVPGITLPACWP